MAERLDAGSDPTTMSLNVYPAYEGQEGRVWNKHFGYLVVPREWDYLPSGDAYLTRTVKKLGPHWVLRKYDRQRRCARVLGLYTSAENIRKVSVMAEETKEAREKRRKLRARYRKRRQKE